MTTANASCPLAIAPATIAAWRDGALPGDESARIAAHVSGCEACRREIALYESLDDALRRQPVPQSDGRLWHAVRAGMASARGPRDTRRTVRRVAGATSALAAVLLLALGFAQLFQARGNMTYHPGATATVVQGTPTPLPTAGPTSPAVRVAAPNWQPGNFPTSGITFGERSDDILSFGVASTNGNIAYACYSQTSNTGGHVNSQITIYRTSDRAVHWTRLAQFPWPDAQTSECVVQVDALDSSRVLVNIGGQDVTTFNEAQWYELTEGSGATWTRLAYDDGLSYLATANGRTYAIRWQVVGQQSNGQPKYDVHLSVSTDHMRTWQPIDVPITSAGGEVNQFWVRPDGTILATVSSGVG
ncbi:MAG TPA: zf-HC2 domain-containing protein, partial [Ktedonobacterales bacterium]|nr:zf-HC2 domain-containing protein [Ktedonobacterales bacterium]